MAANLTAADAVGLTLAWLRAHPVISDLGGPDHVSGLYEAPWPHIRITPSGSGDLRDLRWETVQGVQVEVVDHPAGPVGQHALWVIAVRVSQALLEITERPVTESDPVVSAVRPTGVFAWSPLVGDRGRWLIGFQITVRPPLA